MDKPIIYNIIITTVTYFKPYSSLVWPRHSFAAKSLITDFDDVESEINRLLTPRYLPSAGISSSDCSDKSSH